MQVSDRFIPALAAVAGGVVVGMWSRSLMRAGWRVVFACLPESPQEKQTFKKISNRFSFCVGLFTAGWIAYHVKVLSKETFVVHIPATLADADFKEKMQRLFPHLVNSQGPR